MTALQRPGTQKPQLTPTIVLGNINWEGYEKILDALSESAYRSTYDRGSLEIMSPYTPHEVYRMFFGRLLGMLAEEWDVTVKTCGSTTFRKKELEKGLEPDECFYLGSMSKVRDWRKINLSRDPPPDLVIEIDMTPSSMNRLAIYADLGVPEVWRFDEKSLEVHQLQGGKYERVEASLAFPGLPLAELVPFFQQYLAASDGEMLKALREWVRRHPPTPS